jgi:hypothetical protein
MRDVQVRAELGESQKLADAFVGPMAAERRGSGAAVWVSSRHLSPLPGQSYGSRISSNSSRARDCQAPASRRTLAARSRPL